MPGIEPIAAQAQSTLRRRIRALENPHHKEMNSERRGDEHHTEETVLSHDDYESESSEADDNDNDNSPERVEDDGPALHRSVSEALEFGSRSAIPSHSLPQDRLWYEFDLAVVAALVSPIGNWLTGGDHIKNVLLVLLLLFYLHQIIEVPWSLYHKSRPRHRPPHIRSNFTTAEERYQDLAATELRKFELLLLGLTIISPFVGAMLIHVVSTAVLGDQAFSWFSIGLFVLATGVRPWSHVFQLITTRVTDLHDIVHYPAHHPTSNGDFRSELEQLRKQVQQLDATISQLNQRRSQDSEEVYEYVDDALDAVEKSFKKHEKKCDKQEGKFRDLESVVDGMKKNRLKQLAPVSVSTTSYHYPRSLGDRLASLLSLVLPPWLLPPPPKGALYNDGRHSPSSLATRYAISSPSSPDGLETIVEETDPLQAAADMDSPPPKHFNLLTRLFIRFAYLAMFPLRSVKRMVFGYV